MKSNEFKQVSRPFQQTLLNQFVETVYVHQAHVRNVLRKMTHGDVELANELAQETFIQAWRHWGRFRNQSSIKTWLHRIAYNEYLQWFRKQRADSLTHVENESILTEPTVNSFSVWQQQLSIDVKKAIQMLTPEEQVVLIHHYYADLTHQEVAEILDMPLGTVKSHLLRAKEKMRPLLLSWSHQFDERVTNG